MLLAELDVDVWANRWLLDVPQPVRGVEPHPADRRRRLGAAAAASPWEAPEGVRFLIRSRVSVDALTPRGPPVWCTSPESREVQTSGGCDASRRMVQNSMTVLVAWSALTGAALGGRSGRPRPVPDVAPGSGTASSTLRHARVTHAHLVTSTWATPMCAWACCTPASSRRGRRVTPRRRPAAVAGINATSSTSPRHSTLGSRPRVGRGPAVRTTCAEGRRAARPALRPGLPAGTTTEDVLGWAPTARPPGPAVPHRFRDHPRRTAAPARAQPVRAPQGSIGAYTSTGQRVPVRATCGTRHGNRGARAATTPTR